MLFNFFKAVEDKKAAARRETYMKRHEHLVDTGFTLKETVRNGYSNTQNPSRYSQGLSSSNTSSSSNLSSSSSANKVYNSSLSSNQSSSNNNLTNGSSNEKSGAVKKPPLIPRLDDGCGAPKGMDDNEPILCLDNNESF